MTTAARYGRKSVTLPDGRRVTGKYPGLSGVTILEHMLRDELAETVRGMTEAALPYGRADVLSEQAVFEVESYAKWRNGMRQVLAYGMQTGLRPSLALFGKAHGKDDVGRLYKKLRDGTPRVDLWWFNGTYWTHVHANAACRNMLAPDVAEVTRKLRTKRPGRVLPELVPEAESRPYVPKQLVLSEAQRRAMEAHAKYSPGDQF